MSRLRSIAALLSLAVMVCGAYYPASRAGFIMDDPQHVVADYLMTAPDGLYRIWFDPGASAWNYWPLSRTSFWIERRLWGVNAQASHTANIFLHLANVLILYAGLRRFKVPQAWFIAGLFAVHPIFVESVAWITERKNVLSGAFYLLSIWGFLSFDEKRQWRFYGGSLFLFLCALLSKSSTVMLPVILVFAKLALGRTWTRRDCLLLAPFLLLSLLSAAASVWFEENYLGSSGPRFDRDFAEQIAVAARIPFFYLWKILIPWPLLFVYPKWQIDAGSALEYLPLAAMLVLGLVLLRLNSKAPARALLLGLGAFLASLFPVLGFFDIAYLQHSFVANHWLYLPALPILILCGIGLGTLLKNRTMVRHITCAAILAACAILTWQRCRVFQSSEGLWRDTLARNPASWVAHANLAAALQEQGRGDEALKHHFEALRLEPNDAKVHSDLGAALQKMDRIDEAIEHYVVALRLAPDFAKAHSNLGTALRRKGRIDEAVRHYEEAIRIDPNDAMTHYNLGNVTLTQGRIDEAVEHYSEALRLRPEYAEAHNNLGIALLQKTNTDAAIGHFREALRINPAHADARTNLERALSRRGRNP